ASAPHMPSRALLGKNPQTVTPCGKWPARRIYGENFYEAVERFARPRPCARTAPSANAISTRSTPRSTRSTTSSPSSASARDAPCRDAARTQQPVFPVPRKRPTSGDPNVVGTPEIVGTPLSVAVHGGGLSEVDGVDGAEEMGDGGASGLSVLMTGAEGFGISATEGGLRPPPPISVAPRGIPTAPTGDPGVAVPAGAMAAPPPPIAAQGPDRPAVVPPPAALAPMPPPPAPAPVPPPANAALLAAPVA